MDAEKTVQFLLEQQAAFAARMGEVHTIVEQMAVNQVALGKAQSRFDASMREMQSHAQRADQRFERLGQNMERSDQRMERIEQNMERADQRMDRIEQNMDRLVNALNGRFGANGSVP